MRRTTVINAVLAVQAAVAAHANDLVPTGTLRATYIATNPVQASIDPATKETRGPGAEIARALSRKFGVPLDIKGARGPAGVIDSVKQKQADIGFLAYDALRAAEVDFSQTYSLAQNSYLVLDGSPLRSVDEMDPPGHRTGVADRDAGDLFLTRTLKSAELRSITGSDIEIALKQLKSGEIHAYGTNRQRLTGVAAKTPGVSIVSGNFYGVEQSVIVANGNKALLAAVDTLLDEARSSGLIAAAIVRARLSGVDVAPPRDGPRR